MYVYIYIYLFFWIQFWEYIGIVCGDNCDVKVIYPVDGRCFLSRRRSWDGFHRQESDIWVSLKMGSFSPVLAMINQWNRVAPGSSGSRGRFWVQVNEGFFLGRKGCWHQEYGVTTCFAYFLCTSSWWLASPFGVALRLWSDGFHWNFSDPGPLEHWFSAQKQEELRRSSADAGPGQSRRSKFHWDPHSALRFLGWSISKLLKWNYPSCVNLQRHAMIFFLLSIWFFQLQALEKWLEEDPEER